MYRLALWHMFVYKSIQKLQLSTAIFWLLNAFVSFYVNAHSVWYKTECNPHLYDLYNWPNRIIILQYKLL